MNIREGGMITSRVLEVAPYERVRVVTDSVSGLHAVIAVHSTRLGPAAGGCRFWSYGSEEAAITDALRLAKGMSYKNALAGLPLGGGKAVILKSDGLDRDALFRGFGQAVESFAGRYITAEDVGTTVDDMRVIATQTRHVSGISGGDPSPWTALGVFLAIREAVLQRLGRLSLEGLTIAVQGVGNVGWHLCKLAAKAGARLIIADPNGKHVIRTLVTMDCTVLPVEGFHRVACDVFAPCALGSGLNRQTVPELNTPIVCGAANNQLETDEDGEALRARGILYVPDYVANAGGIINVAAEYLGWSPPEVTAKVEKIPQRVRQVLDIAKTHSVATNRIADDMAADLIERSVPRASTTVPVCA